MQEADCWAASANAMEVTVKVNSLIARELTDMLRNAWRRLGAGLIAMMTTEHSHLPPI